MEVEKGDRGGRGAVCCFGVVFMSVCMCIITANNCVNMCL